MLFNELLSGDQPQTLSDLPGRQRGHADNVMLLRGAASVDSALGSMAGGARPRLPALGCFDVLSRLPVIPSGASLRATWKDLHAGEMCA